MEATWKNRVQLGGCVLIGVGFVYQNATPLFLSLGSLLLGTSALLPPYRFKATLVPILIALIWTGTLLSGIWSENTPVWQSIITRQLALLLIPLGYLSGWTLSRKQQEGVHLFWMSLAGVFALFSLLRYFLHTDAINAALLESGAVPIWDGVSWPWKLTPLNSSQFEERGVSHIYFSVLQAFAVLYGALYGYRNKKPVYLVLALLHLVTLHWFLARTGLIAFYGACSLVFVYGLWHSRQRLRLGLLALVVLSLPILSWFGFESVRNKVKNSLSDLEAVESGTNINHRSLAMRLEAWKTAGELIRENPMGVGAGDMDDRMQERYESNASPLWKENRIPPHNQFLETTLANGYWAGLALVLLFLAQLVRSWKRKDLYGLIAAGIFVPAFCFESMLQTQLGICMFPFLMLLIPFSGAD